MVVDADTLVGEVRVAMDENPTLLDSGFAKETATLTLDELIKSKLAEAVEAVELEAPVWMLEEGHNFGDSIHWDDRVTGTGWILLPDDFMRLVAFRMSDWERTVYTALSPEDSAYMLQSSRFAGIRGNVHKPVAAIGVLPEGRVLEFYSCRDDSQTIATASYRPYPRIDRYGGIDLSRKLRRAVVYMAAGLTYMSLGEGERANGYIELSKSKMR